MSKKNVESEHFASCGFSAGHKTAFSLHLKTSNHDVEIGLKSRGEQSDKNRLILE